MSLLFGMPDGLSHDVESAFAAIQTWAGKQDGNGKWTDVVIDGNGLSAYLHVDGTGNTWTLGPASSHAGTSLAYALSGDTMTYGFSIVGTALTVVTAINAVSLLIPDGYAAAKRSAISAGFMVNAATGQGALFTVRSGDRYLTIGRINGGLLADDSGGAFTVQGQITFEVTRSL
jgi:hypothetical protein